MLSSYTVIALVFTIIYNGFAFVFIIVLVIGTYGNVHLTRKTRFSVPHLFCSSIAVHCSSFLYFYDFWDWSFGRITDISSFSSCWAYCRCFVLFFISSVLQIFSLHWLSSIQRLAQSDSYIKGNSLCNKIQKNLKHVMTCGYSHIVVDCTMGLSNALWIIVNIAAGWH